MTGIDWPTLPDMGVYLTWPQSGRDAIHPDDLTVAESLIPSDRVFRRTAFDGTYYTVEYGDQAIRIKPSLWLQVADEGFRIGDQVEVPSRMMQADPMIAVIAEMRYSQDHSAILYHLMHNEMPIPREFIAQELIQLTQRIELHPPDFESPIPRHDPSSDTEKPIPLENEPNG